MSFLRQLVEEINLARTNPAAYASKVQEYIPHFQDKILKMPDQRVAIKTQEGAAAYEECVNFLRSAEPTEAHVPSRGLTRIAKVISAELWNLEVQHQNKLLLTY